MKQYLCGLLLLFVPFIGWGPVTQAASSLPASDWYAVIWNRSADTLHWVNNATELASMPRPQMPGEIMGSDLYISPNGRWMMMTSMLADNRQAIGFYDLQTGAWLQTHMAQPGETIIAAERNPFTRNSEYAAIGLHSNTGWRVITFETATGDALDVLTNEHPDIAPNLLPPQAVPRVTLYSLDEGMVQWRVHIRFVTLGPNQGPTQQPSLGWYPQQDIVYVDSFHPLLLDLDILPIQNRVLYSLRDDNDPTQTRIYQQTLGHSGEVAYQQSGAFINQPRWIAGGQFVAYRMTQGAQVPMWYLGGVGSADLIPFAPDYDELLGTVDGFVLVDYEGGEVKFANTLAFEAFSPTVGNVIYTTDTSNFHIAYITPMGLDFTLESLATLPAQPGLNVAAGDAAPDEPTVPPTVGFVPPPLDPSPPPPTPALMLEAVTAQPTATPQMVVITPLAVQPTQAPLQVAPPINPTSPPAAVDQIQPPQPFTCPGAPPSQVLVGMQVVTQNLGGTLAMRTNLDDPYPSHQIPGGQVMTVQEGPECRNAAVMWRVNTNLNGQSITGWVAEGFGNTYYISKP